MFETPTTSPRDGSSSTETETMLCIECGFRPAAENRARCEECLITEIEASTVELIRAIQAQED